MPGLVRVVPPLPPDGLGAVGTTLRVLTLVVALLPLGCTSDRPGARPGDADSDESSATAEGVGREWVPWRISSTPTVVIGESGGVEYALARVSQVLRFSDGYIVSTGLPIGIRVYDREGRFQRWLGREGEGPGEFKAVSGTWVTEGDTVVAFDSFLRRLTYFNPSGDLLQTVPFHAGGSFVAGEERPRHIIERFSDGSFLSFQRITPPLPNTPDPEVTTSSNRYYREAPGTLLRDTITQVVDWDVSYEKEPGFPIGTWVAVPFTPTASAVVDDTVLYVADGRHFELEAWSFRGRFMARYKKDHEVVPITDEVWAGELERREENFLARMGSTGNRQRLDVQAELAAMRRRFRGEKRLPTLPVHGRRMKADSDGNIWIEAWPDDLNRPSFTWHLFLAESEGFVGSVEMPPRFRPVSIYSDLVVGIQTDELDVQSVRVYPILK